ncbi:NAD(P)/FAD-dependent oxidoreductase [Aliiroseovarius crassostreae]|uniref:NAD(P)/FAD-dependent oxidoreductase n=1 Tax=Aliiroseovarius crassostreae TaxID=154981 RepID=A0A9Q9LY54_9RHOB|nr:NAD(P)/FAD-dependent oxidoreductase [Aliiroseovarius crassostreae]UWP93726.1 NAD(P)/FAD-dependent oxidoreductase [Aliiroseovarius crassostreae]UWP96272.1 NAD(P)/FAD-dependent oxidoreductase [Aliiroseovarius crassostreae]
MIYDTIIIGAGAAGLFCATRTGGRTLVIDHAKRPGEKIRISGGGRCNFTNMYCEPGNFLGQNRHFHKSALSRFGPWDFVAKLDQAGINWHEKTLGQLFCDDKATQIVELLVSEAKAAGAEIRLSCSVQSIAHDGQTFVLTTPHGPVQARALVLATGGKSIPKMGATGFAYDIARQFGHEITETRPGLVPFTFPEGRFAPLSGLSLPVRVWNARAQFEEALLFTHRGLSGPAILQISSYWREGESVTIDLTAGISDGRGLLTALRDQRQRAGRRNLTTELGQFLPAKLVDFLAPELGLSGNLADQSDTRLREICDALANWTVTPSGTEGYRTAEVTLGGVATSGLDSKTMMSKHQDGLYFIGECVDVTGWLGGFNFQWAWASAHAAGAAIAARNAG